MPIRICHLITSLDTGGAQRSLVNLLTAMNRDEFENEVVTLLKPGPMAQTLEQAGIPDEEHATRASSAVWSGSGHESA